MSIDNQKNNDRDPPSNNKYAEWITKHKGKGAELIVLGLYFLLDAHGQWPESHSVAIAAFVMGLSAVLLIEIPWKPWLLATFGSAILGLALYAYVGPARQNDAEVINQLEPGNEPTPPNACDAAIAQMTPQMREGLHLNDAYKIFVGDSTFLARRDLETSLVEIGTCKGLSITSGPDGLLAYGDIYTPDGKLIGRLIKNELKAVIGDEASEVDPIGWTGIGMT